MSIKNYMQKIKKYLTKYLPNIIIKKLIKLFYLTKINIKNSIKELFLN